VRQNVAPWTEVRDRLNRILRGLVELFRLRDAADGVSRGRPVRVRARSVFSPASSQGAFTRQTPFRMRLCSGSWACCGCETCTLGDFRRDWFRGYVRNNPVIGTRWSSPLPAAPANIPICSEGLMRTGLPNGSVRTPWRRISNRPTLDSEWADVF
jgi:hypothetical protein